MRRNNYVLSDHQVYKSAVMAAETHDRRRGGGFFAHATQYLANIVNAMFYVWLTVCLVGSTRVFMCFDNRGLRLFLRSTAEA